MNCSDYVTKIAYRFIIKWTFPSSNCYKRRKYIALAYHFINKLKLVFKGSYDSIYLKYRSSSVCFLYFSKRYNFNLFKKKHEMLPTITSIKVLVRRWRFIASLSFLNTWSRLFLCSRYAQWKLLWDGDIEFECDIGTARIIKICFLNEIKFQQQQQQ